jgi:hypothetical protein
MERILKLGATLFAVAMISGLGAWSARPSIATVLLPGSSELSTSHLNTSATRYRVLTKPAPDSAEREVPGVGSASVTLTKHNGKPALLLVTGFVRAERTYADTALVMQDGLHPVWEVSSNGTRTSRWDYSGKQVKLTFTQADSGTQTRTHAYDVPVFHFNELDVLLRSLPLREGYEAILPLYSEGSDELEMDSVRVSARGADGVWPVRFADPAIVASYGIDGATRRIVRYSVVLRRTGGVSRRVPIE